MDAEEICSLLVKMGALTKPEVASEGASAEDSEDAGNVVGTVEQKNEAETEISSVETINSAAYMQDPIVANRLSVELLQRLGEQSKPEVVIAPAGAPSYFGYSLALTAWARFTYVTQNAAGKWELPEGVSLAAKQRVIIALDTFDEQMALSLVNFVDSYHAKPIALLSLTGVENKTIFGTGSACKCISLL